MILIDYSHLSSRNLFTAISQAKPKKDKETKKFKTEDFIQFYKHLMLNSLRLIQKKYMKEYGEIVLCLDVRGNNWRKDYYPEYKAHRAKHREESDIDFEEFYAEVNKLIEDIDEILPYKILGVSGAEGDDVIAVLAKHYSNQKTLVISSDKDFKQLLEYPHVEIYDPLKMIKIKMSPNELKKWKIDHILDGDNVDNIPNIVQGTEFSDAFLGYLKSKDIFISDVLEFEGLKISKKLYEEFDVYKKFKSGPKKGQSTGELDIFKTTRFGDKTREEFALDLKENLKSNPLYQRNFLRNKQLVLFSEIPKNMEDKILSEYSKIEIVYNKNKIITFLGENNLVEIARNVSDFYIDEKDLKVKETSSLDDWL